MTTKDDKNLPVRISAGSQLQNTGGRGAGQLIDNALANLNKEQAQAIAGKAAEEALRLEVKQREQNLDYTAGKKTIEDHIDAAELLTRQGGGVLNRQKIVTDVKTGAGNMRLETKTGGNCFVATAAFRDQEHATVQFLRHYRDTRLSKSARGRSFVNWYWKAGPPMAAMVDRSKALQAISRWCLNAVVLALRTLKL